MAWLLVFALVCVTVAGMLYVVATYPWWVSLTGLVLFGVLAWLGGKWLILRMLTLPFRAKGAVLQNAAVEIHEIRPAPVPVHPQLEESQAINHEPAVGTQAREAQGTQRSHGARPTASHPAQGDISSHQAPDHAEDEPLDEEELEYERELAQQREAMCWYDVDLTVTPVSQQGEAALWEPGELTLTPTDFKPDLDQNPFDEETGEIYAYRIYRDGAFIQDSSNKHFGPQRLLLRVGVLQPPRTMRLVYYFEPFGQLHFPDPESSSDG